MAEHTPGPWAVLHGFPNVIVMDADRALANGGSINAYDYGTRYARQIARVFTAHNMPGDLESNARLIAVAPLLLAKCEKIVAWLDRNAAKEEQAAAKEHQFISLKDARLADAKNYRATAADIRAVIAKTKETEKADA